MDKVTGEIQSSRVATWFKMHWTTKTRLKLAQATKNPQVLHKLANSRNSQVRFHAAMNEKCNWIDVAIALSKIPKDIYVERVSTSVEEGCYMPYGKNMRMYDMNSGTACEYPDNDSYGNGYANESRRAAIQILDVHKNHKPDIIAYLAELNPELRKSI